MGISDRDLEVLIQRAKKSDDDLELCAKQLQRLNRSSEATTTSLNRIVALLQAMNLTIDSQNQRIAENSQAVAEIKKHLGL